MAIAIGFLNAGINLQIIKHKLKQILKPYFTARDIHPRFVRRGGWLTANLPSRFVPPKLAIHEKVEERAVETQHLGGRTLWNGYKDVANYPRPEGQRTSDQVRSTALMGRFYSWLANQRKEHIIVEFGTAFGVSGMYWLSGIGSGHLYTFEPNAEWAAIANENLKSISGNYTLTVDIFEAAGPKILAPKSVGIAFVDAIHTSEFVFRQLEILKPLVRPGGLIVLDDIGFSPDMATCWKTVARDPSFTASATLTPRVGIIELP